MQCLRQVRCVTKLRAAAPTPRLLKVTNLLRSASTLQRKKGAPPNASMRTAWWTGAESAQRLPQCRAGGGAGNCVRASVVAGGRRLLVPPRWQDPQAPRPLVEDPSSEDKNHPRWEMTDNKPWVLISEVGDQGFHEDVVDIINQHFRIICLQEFLQNPALHGPKIQGMFMWNHSPAAEPSLLSCLPSLKVIANGGVGIDHLDLPYINSFGVKVANTPGVVSDATADMAMALLLASARTVLEGHLISVDSKTTHVPQSLMGVEVTGSTLGIIGMGHIGYKVAQRSKGFNMRILYHNRNRRSIEDEQAVGASYCEKLGDLLKESDFVVVVVNLTPDTAGLISHRELSLMKPTATLVNVSRGLVVDQDALVKALTSGTIRAAALDVTHPEPLPRNHPLLSLPNVLITPHIGTNTRGTIRKMVQMMVDNVLAAVKGEAVPNEVKAKISSSSGDKLKKI